jgi:hypothetical protein
MMRATRTRQGISRRLVDVKQKGVLAQRQERDDYSSPAS